MTDLEELDVVDDADRVLARASRARIHDEYLIHRSVMFFVLDDQDKVYVNQRSALKRPYPHYWSLAFGGHVHAGESYDDAVIREAMEETGLPDRVFPIASFQKRNADERENVRVYGLRASSEPHLFAEEIEQGQFASMAALSEMLGRFDFLPETPDLLKCLTGYTARRL